MLNEIYTTFCKLNFKNIYGTFCYFLKRLYKLITFLKIALRSFFKVILKIISKRVKQISHYLNTLRTGVHYIRTLISA